MRYKVLIIEDEEPARALIRQFLSGFPGLELVEECRDGFEGLRCIRQHQPDIIFLDIQMPRINGIEMLELVDEKKMPYVIFTTAYDDYAIRAFELNAADYLLKPIASERFTLAVNKVLRELKDHGVQQHENLLKVIEQGFPGEKHLDRIVVHAGSGIELIPDQELFCIQANDDYVLICTENKEYLKKKTLKYYESRLDPAVFARVHRSFIVNVGCIQRIEPYSKDAWMAILKNDRRISVSKQGYSALRKAFDF
jgi:two-component system, LytTR family, response regulator